MLYAITQLAQDTVGNVTGALGDKIDTVAPACNTPMMFHCET